MSYDIEQHIVIEGPPAQVWRWAVGDPSRELRWRNLDGTGVQELEQLDDGPLAVGTRFRGVVKVGPGRPEAYVNELTAVDEPRLVSWEIIDADGALGGRGSYRLVPLAGGARTRFEIELDYPPRNLLGRLQRPVVRLVAGRMIIPRMIAKLKHLVEHASVGEGAEPTRP